MALLPTSFPGLTLRSIDGFLSSFFLFFWSVLQNKYWCYTVFLWIGLLWKNKREKTKTKKIFSGISFMGDKKRVVFVYFICQHVPYSVGDARSFTSWGVLQDFFSRVYLSDRRKSMLFWEQASRQALLICVFLFFWEASGVNFRALIVLGKGVNPVDRRTTMRWTRFFFFFLSLSFAVYAFFDSYGVGVFSSRWWTS